MKKLDLQNKIGSVQMDLKEELKQRDVQRDQLMEAHKEMSPDKEFTDVPTGKKFMKNYEHLKDAYDGLANVLTDLKKYQEKA